MYIIHVLDFYVKIVDDSNIEYVSSVQEGTKLQSIKEAVEITEHYQIQGFDIEKI